MWDACDDRSGRQVIMRACGARCCHREVRDDACSCTMFSVLGGDTAADVRDELTEMFDCTAVH